MARWIEIPLPTHCGDMTSADSPTGAIGMAPSRRSGGVPGLTPGLSGDKSPWAATAASAGRGMTADLASTALWAVVGANIHSYMISSPFTKTALAATLSGSLHCRIIDAETHMVVVDHNGADTRACVKSPPSVASVTPPAGTFRDATYQDGYTIYSREGTDEFYVSALGDPTTIGALDFSTADALPGVIVGLISDHRELVIFKESSIEFWANTGGTFPFARSQPGVAEIGCMAKATICKYGNALYWVGSDANVYTMTGYQPKRISLVENGGDATGAVVGVGMASPEAICGSIAIIRGAPYYVLTELAGDWCCLYDIERGVWSLCYPGAYIGAVAHYRPAGYANAVSAAQVVESGTHYVIDRIGDSVAAAGRESNRLETSTAAYVYGGVAVRLAPIVLPRRAVMHALEIEVRNTSSPTYRLYLKDDDGSWTTTPMTATPAGGRVRFTRLGGFRRRSIEVYLGWDPISAPGQLVTDEITGIRALIDVGE